MRLYFFIHYSNTNANSYNHIISFSQILLNYKKLFPVIVLNSNSILFYFRKGCLHISKRIFLLVSDLIPKNSILHFWSPRRYIDDYYYCLVDRFKLVIHLEDNYLFLSQCKSNKCYSEICTKLIINKFHYCTSINKNISSLFTIPQNNYFLLKAPSIIHETCTYHNNLNILHLGTINQYNYCQIYGFIKANQTDNLKFVLVGKNFFSKSFRNFNFCYDYGFVKEIKLMEILSNTLASFVPYLVHDFDFYRYPSKVPDLLTAGVPTLLPDYEYYQDIFNEFPELKYDKPKKGRRVPNLSKFLENAKCVDYRKKLSQFSKDYFSCKRNFIDFIEIVI